MIASTTNTLSAPSKHDTAKKWLQQRLWKPASRTFLRGQDHDGVKRRPTLSRPQTAPSSGRATPVPQIQINIELPMPRLAIFPPSRPPRPDSAVIRDVNAWLDARMSKPSPPLMGGLPYWRSVSAVPATTSKDVQYAIPIVGKPAVSEVVTPLSQPTKSFYRRAKKVQVKMPSLLRTTSQRIVYRKQVDRRSNSMPLLAVPYEQTQTVAPPKFLTRSRSFMLHSSNTSISKMPAEIQELMTADEHSYELPPLRSARASTAYSGPEASSDQQTHVLYRQSTRSGDNTRPSTAGAHLQREDSMGDLSEAPTYSSGRPPPSYRSRTASVLTTSSFGCIDGLSPAQRQINQQRAAMRVRGVRGRVKELRRRFQNE
jgi:hypothetical protein